MSVNLLLWITIGFSFFEHIRRLKSEGKLNVAIEKGLQQAKLASIGEMASGLAHEINQPLATIETYAGIMHKKYTTSTETDNIKKELNYLEQIRKQTQRCSKIIKTVLTMNTNNKFSLGWQRLAQLQRKY